MATIPSIAMIPSGYKASKVYSVLPTDGAGDLTFSRAGALPSFNATRVNSDGLIEQVLSNVPRLDYSDGGCPSLLIEPQSTNFLTNSDGNLATYTTNSNVSDAVIPINGFSNSIQFGNNSVSRLAYKRNFTPTIGVQYTLSVFVQMDDDSLPNIGITNISGDFSLTISGNISNINVLAQRVNDTNVYKCSASFVATTTNTQFGVIKFLTQSAKGFRITGIQLEALPYATSYIPTVASTVTRVAETVSKTGISSLIGQTEGTLYVEGTFNAQTSATKRILSLSDGTINNEILIQNPLNSNNIQFVVIDAASTVVAVTVSNKITFGTNFKVAFVYSENYFVAYFNGEKIAEDLSGTVPLCSKVTLGRGNNTTLHEGTVKNLQVYTTALSDVELIALTTL
jgi:hypothetical protein